VGWKLGQTQESELVVTALRNALVLRQPQAGLYFHSDRGSQYSSPAARKPLNVIGAEQSTLKTECFPENQLFCRQAQARREIFEHIELYYNNQRLHSVLGYWTPRQYQTKFERVIEIEINQAQGLDAAREDRARLFLRFPAGA